MVTKSLDPINSEVKRWKNRDGPCASETDDTFSPSDGLSGLLYNRVKSSKSSSVFRNKH